LLRRHGPMVLGVCRRVLRNDADAHDAFQATFLVFVRKAGSIVPRARVGNWLHGVAHKTALKARAMNRLRRAKEQQAPAPQARPGAPAAVPAALFASTVQAATAIAAGRAATAGLIAPEVVALTEGVLRTMLLTKLRTLTAAVLGLALLGAGVTYGTLRAG